MTKAKTLEEAADQALGAENVADLQAQMQALRADMAGLAEILAAMSRHGSDGLGKAAAGAFQDVKDRQAEHLAQAEARARDMLAALAEQARRSPLQSLGIAAGVGMILGLLFGRK